MFNKITLFSFIFTFLPLFLYPLLGQDDRNIVILEHADSLVTLEINGQEVRQLIGNVVMSQGKTIITCSRATHFLESNIVEMDGMVEVKDDTMRLVGARGKYYVNHKIAEAYDRVMLQDPTTYLTALYGKYYAEEKRAYFKGNVYIEDTTSTITTDEVQYYRENGKAVADGNVKIVNQRNRLTVIGGHLENYRNERYSKVTQNPMLIQIDVNSNGKYDTLFVSALMLEAFRDSMERLIATDSVKIFREGLSAQAGLCVYYTDIDSIELKNSPYIWYQNDSLDQNQVSGEEIFIKLQNRKLKTVYVNEKAVAISRADTTLKNRFNQMTGRAIILHFSDNKIREINVVKTATSLYYLFDKNVPNGMNITTGDRIIITFSDGKIDKIKGISGIEGKYYPEKLIAGKEYEFNLPEFNWKTDRPARPVDARIK